MVDIVILCPITVEFEAVYPFLDSPIERQDPISKQEYHLGIIPVDGYQWKVALFETEPGIENLGSVTSRIIYLLRPTYVFLVGVAGGVKDVVLGDLVVATKAYGYDSGKETSTEVGIRPNVIDHPREMLGLCRKIKKSFENKKKPFKVVFGPIASGNKVIASMRAATYQTIKKNYNDTVALEMEAIGFAKAASQANVRFANIRGISDLLENKAECDRNGCQKVASDRAAEFTVELIRSLPFPVRPKKGSRRFKISYLEKPVGWISFRHPKKGAIIFNEIGIELETENETLELREIKSVQHISMKGDLARNWVQVEFKKGDGWIKVYFSAVTPVGLGYWIGGSKQLLKAFESYQSTESHPLKIL